MKQEWQRSFKNHKLYIHAAAAHALGIGLGFFSPQDSMRVEGGALLVSMVSDKMLPFFKIDTFDAVRPF
jgi:hypothetical protein